MHYEWSINKLVKFSKLIFPIFLLFCMNSFAEVTLSIYPTPVVSGEESTLIINSSEGKAEIKNLPQIDNLQWLNSNSQVQNLMIINGVKYIKTSYPFIIKKPGRIILPSMIITTEGKKELSTAEKEILVSTGPLSDLESVLFIKCEYSADKKEYYVGEDIQLKINVYKSVDLNADPIEYPQIKMNNIIFDKFKNNPHTDKFAQYPYGTPNRVTMDGIDYIETTFYTSFRSLSEGEIKGVVSLAFKIRIGGNRGGSRRSSIDSFFEDSFFNSSFFGKSNYATRIINAEIPEIKVSSLPPVPTDSNYLGLIGNWDIKTEVKYNTLKEGEPITVILNISGYGSTENLNAPEINLAGFNSYSPEVLNRTDRISGKQNIKINYVLIPIDSGKTNFNLNFSTFDIETGKYESVNIKEQFDIQRGGTQGTKSAFLSSSNEIVKKPKAKVSDSILYITVDSGKSIEVPLYRNYFFIILFLIIGGPVILIIYELLCFRKKYITGVKGFERRNKAYKRKHRIIKNLEHIKNMKELAVTVQQEVIPYINDLKNFPPGTTVNDLEEKLENKELVQSLKDAEALAYMPGKKGSTEELKRKILKIVKRFSIFFLIFSVIMIASNNNIFGEETDAKINEFAKLYNNGKFDDALKICLNQINMSAPNPNWIYNLGNCYYQKGDLAKALVYYERALRLEPRNTDILENLNFIRRKLFMPEVYQTTTPYELMIYFRDHLRPDEWLLIFAAAWFILFTGLTIRRKCSGKIWITIVAIAIFVCFISGIAYISEHAYLYNPDRAVIIERNVKVYSLPTKESTDTNFILNPGDIVNIEENLQNWIRVRKGKSEGWISNNAAEQIWPY